jgi:hypothetical protein
MESKKYPYYTLQVTLTEPLQGTSNKQVNLKNLSADQVAKYREEMFLIGIRIEHTVRSWEIIPPAKIKTVMIIGEDTKF